MITLEETLRKALVESGLSIRSIFLATGIHRFALASFLRGERTLTLETADRLAEFFGIKIEPWKGLKRGTLAQEVKDSAVAGRRGNRNPRRKADRKVD